MDMVAPGVVTERETRSTRENALRDLVRVSWRATRGLTTVAESEARTLVSRMEAMGRISSDQGDRLMNTLMHRMQGSRDRFEKRVDAAIVTAMKRLEEVSTREVARLSSEVSRLEQRVSQY